MGRAFRLAPVVAAIVLAACPAASAATRGPASAAPASTTTTLPGTAANTSKCAVVLGAGVRWIKTTSPCEVAVPRGLTVSVDLSGHYRWGPLATSSRAVVAVTSSHPSAGGLTGTLRGRSLGAAWLTSPGAPICPPGQACPQYVMLWRLKVKVVAPTPVARSVTVTQADASAPITLAKGQQLVVNLSAAAAFTWSTPAAANATILMRLSGSPGHATFRAVGVGSTSVSAVQSPDCYPACLPPSKLVQFRVIVQ